jgi:DNA-binding GntR family transcriptional regulator
MRSTLAERVYDHIKLAILDGQYGLEEWLPIDRIASELTVSRQPVMDSMRRLAVEGFVGIVPQVGCRLRSYDAVQVMDFFRLFADGEARIAELAAERADAAALDDMRATSTRIGLLRRSRLSEELRSRAYRQLNRALHGRMRMAVQSSAVAEIVESMGDRSDFFIAQANRPIFTARLVAAHAEHEALLQALEERDPSKAAEIGRKHILAIGERLRALPANALLIDSPDT